MARIFITGSSTGLGQMAGEVLIRKGHQVVLHARNQRRAQEALVGLPQAESVLIGDLANMEETKQLAAAANALGGFDAVIHNAGIYRGSGEEFLAVNTLAPYILTCLIHRPARLIYLSSDLHLHGDASVGKITAQSARVSYADSKLFVMLLMKAVARLWPGVVANAVDPGWVPTRMGGPSATDDLAQGFETQAWLAVSNDASARVSGRYFYHRKPARYHPAADNIALQDALLSACEQRTGVRFPIG
jgi:NAD(P)-dependent dehydrogenase (short-subunit alcohol dehydrogenase family)